MLEKALGSPLACREIRVNPPENRSWIFIGRADADAEALVLWLHFGKSWLIGKDPDAGKDWRQEKKEKTENEIAGWDHWVNRHEFEQSLGDGEGQGSLAYYNPWGCTESDTTEWLNCHMGSAEASIQARLYSAQLCSSCSVTSPLIPLLKTLP